MRTETTKRVMISELGPVIRRHRRTVATRRESAGWIGGSGAPSIISSASSVSTSAGADVVLGFDYLEVDGQDHGEYNGNDSSSHRKPEYGSPKQGSATIMLRFGDILFEVLFGFRDQRSSGRSERVSWRCVERREICKWSWRLKWSIVLARCVGQNLFRSGRGRWDAILGGGAGHGGGEGRNGQRRPPRRCLLYIYQSIHHQRASK